MTSTSRSGLIATPKRHFASIKKHKAAHERLPAKFEATPMALSLRPLGGLLNPFAKGCSVLCNHPAPTAVKDIINQYKSSLATDGRNVHKQQLDNVPLHGTDNIPEDLFRRYTDTDSRPLTPSPTVTSVRTRASATSSFLNNRRCITPEWGKNEQNQRKKIILDLRRSHSQETLYWKPASDTSQGGAADSELKSKSAGVGEEKKKRQKSAEQRPKSSLAAAGKTEATCDADDVKQLPQTCINEHLMDDEDVRRGKKRKKPKPAAAATTTFHLSNDPETQVATLGPDSMNPSTRPSLIPTSVSLLPSKEKHESVPVLLKGSFLTDDAFQALKTELDIDVIENSFGRYLNRARREAIKYITPKQKPVQKLTEEFDKLSLVLQPKMPRKFSKSATRFEVPLNLKSLEEMSVLEYLSKFVWVSRQRKQLYKRVFLKYLKKIEDTSDVPDAPTELQFPLAEYVERTMPMEQLPQALEDVLEFHGNEQNISEMLRLLEYEEMKGKDIDFRSLCGIASFAERLALADPTCTDSCDELEKADFSSMEQRLGDFNISKNLRQVFDVIRHTHLVSH